MIRQASFLEFFEEVKETAEMIDRIHQMSNAKTYVFADSVLCLGGLKENPERGLE